MNLAGVVLAGGKSSRYGSQKIFETYQGLPLYKHSLHALLQGGISDTYISTNKELASSFYQKETDLLVEDSFHEGPLYAFAHVARSLSQRYDWLFLLPSDSPFVSEDFIPYMVSQLQETGNDFDCHLPVSGDTWQPLHAMYHTRILSAAEKCLAQGKRSMLPLLHSIRVNTIPFPEDEPSFVNINRPQDWRRI
ncbi:molybdenum cofactor guanylyltransferase [Alteribacillus iranensis]|uniref:Probable molybdenum cofactor guanylyltransferase n=1 Tax=Alteribacillus iranensis TaxID=930128 RepID=A0A1I2A054_9BACI|nr:molybdenum cofactor guanylyltransferase [Alteribacillus iranensis]SFE36110.1 molybdenum cofactor guanylyltransferase [Alteribacillus iranensis]